MRALNVGLFLVMLLVLLSACGKDQVEPGSIKADSLMSHEERAIALLPEDSESYQLYRREGVIWVDMNETDSASGENTPWQRIGRLAVTYDVGDVGVDVLIDQYSSLDEAFGAFAENRPANASVGSAGTESYLLDNDFIIYGDVYIVTLRPDTAGSHGLAALSLLAQEVTVTLPKKGRPPFFMFFPSKHKVMPSNRYYKTDFLGVPGLEKVYTTDYVLEGAETVYFLTEDLDGQQYDRLYALAESTQTNVLPPAKIPYVSGRAVAFDHPEYGRIVAGNVRSKLVGIVGYTDAYESQATLWVLGLQ